MFRQRSVSGTPRHCRCACLARRTLWSLAALAAVAALVRGCACCRRERDDGPDGGGGSRTEDADDPTAKARERVAVPVQPPSGDNVLQFGASAPPVEPKQDGW